MKPYCGRLECILDWFHIAQKFQNVKNALGEALEKSLESAKWKLWHGNAHDALTKLALLRVNIPTVCLDVIAFVASGCGQDSG